MTVRLDSTSGVLPLPLPLPMRSPLISSPLTARSKLTLSSNGRCSAMPHNSGSWCVLSRAISSS